VDVPETRVNLIAVRRPIETFLVAALTVPEGHASHTALDGSATAFMDVVVSTEDVFPEPGITVTDTGAVIVKQSIMTGVAPTVPER